MRYRLSTLAAVVAVGLAAGSAASAQEHSFRFASLTPEGGYIHEQHLRPFVDSVESDSGGRIDIDLQPVGVFGAPNKLYELVEAGIVDMAWTVQGYTSGRFPQSGVVELPFLFDKAETGSTVLWSMYEEGHFDRDYATVKPLALYTHRPYGLFTTGPEVRQAEDLKGLKVRTPSAIVGQALTLLGGTPVGMQVTEMAEALRLGTIDSSVFPWEAIELFGLQDELTALTDARVAAPRFMVIMNKARYEALPTDLKAVIDSHAGLTLSRAIGAGLDQQELRDKQRFAETEGYTVIDLDPSVRDAMVTQTASVVDDWIADVEGEGVDGETLLARARELISEFE